ncbi:MAG: hypothetical protein ACI4DO_06810 [Roseburia sp.]
MIYNLEVTILDMERFLQAVNSCSGAVNLLNKNGQSENINKQFDIQQSLIEEYLKNRRCLKVTIKIADYRDYDNIIRFFADECRQFVCNSFKMKKII